MEHNSLPAIRPMVPADQKIAMDFFDQMGQRTNAMFNRNQCNRNSMLACFEPEKYGRYASPGIRRNFIAVTPDEAGNDRIAGLVFAWDLDTKTPSIGICVAEDWKGRHLGRKLMDFIMQYCAGQGKAGIFLSTYFDNVEGQGLYRSCGFRRIGIDMYGGMHFFLSFPDTPPAEDGTI